MNYLFSLPLSMLILLLSYSCSNSTDNSKESTKKEVSKLPKQKDESPAPVASKTKVEITSLVKETAKGKFSSIQIYEGKYNGDDLLDFFITAQQVGPAEQLISSYFFYNSEKDQLVKLKFKNGTKSIYAIDKVNINNKLINGNVVLQYEAGDIGTYNQKTTADFSIHNDMIVFENKSVTKLKKAEQLLSREIEMTYESLEQMLNEDNFPNE